MRDKKQHRKATSIFCSPRRQAAFCSARLPVQRHRFLPRRSRADYSPGIYLLVNPSPVRLHSLDSVLGNILHGKMSNYNSSMDTTTKRRESSCQPTEDPNRRDPRILLPPFADVSRLYPNLAQNTAGARSRSYNSIDISVAPPSRHRLHAVNKRRCIL